MLSQNEKACGIIYCKDRETVEELATHLTELGISTKPHHGGLTSRDRKKTKDEWLAGVFPVITATTSFGAGIDKSSVRFVVHWNVPRSLISYYKVSSFLLSKCSLTLSVTTYRNLTWLVEMDKCRAVGFTTAART